MENYRNKSDNISKFMSYLARNCQDGERLPALSDLAGELGVSISALREQLEIARSIGVVEVKPKKGIHRTPYEFKSTVISSLRYAIESDQRNFTAFSDLRRHIESAYWFEAVIRLSPEDLQQLNSCVQNAAIKLGQNPPQIPHNEHRQFHMIIYSRLNNIFVRGLLEAFWDTYEAVGLDKIVEVDYLQRVWQYHCKIIEAIESQEYQIGYQYLIEHMELLSQRPRGTSSQIFE